MGIPRDSKKETKGSLGKHGDPWGNMGIPKDSTKGNMGIPGDSKKGNMGIPGAPQKGNIGISRASKKGT